MRPRKYRSPSRSDHSPERRERVDDFRSSFTAFATGSSSGFLTPLRMSRRMSSSGPANSRASRACTAKCFGASSTMSELSPAVGPSGKSVGLTHGFTGSVVEQEVEAGEVERPSCLPAVELLGGHEVLEVFAVCPNLNFMVRSLEEVPPLLQRPD